MKNKFFTSLTLSFFMASISGTLAMGQTQENLKALESLEGASETLSDTERELTKDDKLPAITALGTELEKWPAQTIDQISLDIRDRSTVVPRDRSGMLVNQSKSSWDSFHPTEKVFAWCAPDISYQPLYFEDVALERYGQTFSNPCLAGAVSAAHFFASNVTYPCQVWHDPFFSCEYPLGYCRPGNLAPCTEKKYLFWCR